MQSTWAADSNTWASSPYTWTNSTYQETAVLTQVILSKVLDEDTVFPRSLGMGGSYGMTGSGAQVMPSSITLANSNSTVNTNTMVMPVSSTLAGTTSIINNVNYPESIVMSATNLTSGTGGLLWGGITEDTSSTWTDSTDASDSWTIVSEDSGTVWTPEDK